jgi:anti-sigma B factor antagonist
VTTPDEFDVTVEWAPDGSAVVYVSGELDLAAAAQFEGAVWSIRDAPGVVIDLTACTFLDSSGVRILAKIARETTKRGARIDLVAADPAVVRVLEITSVDTMAPMHASLDDVP